ncbi:MAG: hypothetical protein A2177_03245 [Spirochaetes bacterium RBG_13_68_11]|nr:MAG: hypothetical protein A2177_03245 [Spirochaetes bacterium RBG_13_68_11]
MKILAIVQGEYGQRHVANIRDHGPSDWSVATWNAPRALPALIDEPEEFLPAALPPADLLLCFQEDSRAAQLIPDAAVRSGARAVVAAIDREEWLPRGLANQLSRWFMDRRIAAVFPKPLCSLTERSSGLRGMTSTYQSPLIAEFARHFGRPSFEIACDGESGAVRTVTVVRDACCGCARAVASRLVGVHRDQAVETAGLAHHHHPCLAGMEVDPDFADTLMHVSGNLMKDAVRDALRGNITGTPPEAGAEGSP